MRQRVILVAFLFLILETIARIMLFADLTSDAFLPEFQTFRLTHGTKRFIQ